MKRCLLFDSDGTLVDSEFLNSQAMSAELAESGIAEEAENIFHAYRGWMFSAVLDDLQKRHDTRLDDGFTERFRQRANLHFEGKLQAVEHIPEVLPQLQQPMCVASNAPQNKLQLALRITGLTSFFGDKVYSAYEINRWKPEPDLFLHAAKRMGFEATRCVVIEDSQVGVDAAIAAGMDVIRYDASGSVVPQNGVILISSMQQLPRALATFD